MGLLVLGEKEDGKEFTNEDEEILVLFASQEAVTIANARKQRARADLEALIDTSPLRVAVFDAKTGQAVPFNREAKRIVGSLSVPGRSLEQLPEIVTCRRADGQKITFTEFPLVQMLSNATTVRDCRNDSYRGAPATGSAWESGHCTLRVLRGGS